jgi:hypothetical protein
VLFKGFRIIKKIFIQYLKASLRRANLYIILFLILMDDKLSGQEGFIFNSQAIGHDNAGNRDSGYDTTYYLLNFMVKPFSMNS